jgi:hypothetical protein
LCGVSQHARRRGRVRAGRQPGGRRQEARARCVGWPCPNVLVRFLRMLSELLPVDHGRAPFHRLRTIFFWAGVAPLAIVQLSNSKPRVALERKASRTRSSPTLPSAYTSTASAQRFSPLLQKLPGELKVEGCRFLLRAFRSLQAPPTAPQNAWVGAVQSPLPVPPRLFVSFFEVIMLATRPLHHPGAMRGAGPSKAHEKLAVLSR